MKIIKCGLLIDGTGRTPERDTAIVIEGERIKLICSFNEAQQLSKSGDATIIDASDKFVIPGLIDSHVHLSFSAGRNPTFDAIHDSDDQLMIRQVKNAQTALRAGITTVRDCGSRGMSLLALRDAINSGFIEGSRIFASGIAVTSTGGHCHFLGGEADSSDEIIKLVRTLSRERADYIKVMLSGGNMTPGSNPQITQYTLEQAETLVRTAHELGKTVAAHVLNKLSIQIAVDAGIDTLEHCAFLDKSGMSDFDQRCIKKAVEKGLYISPAMNYGTLAGYVPTPGEDLESSQVKQKIAFWEELTKTRFATTRTMVQMGAKIIGGTDAGTKNTGFEDYWKSLAALNERCGMSSMQVIESATRLPAEAMGIDDETGTLQPGKVADLVILNENPLLSMKNLTDISDVFFKGKRVAK